MACYVFLPEIVRTLGGSNLSKWLDEQKLLLHPQAFKRELDIEKTVLLEKDFRHEMTEPTICFTVDEALKELDDLPRDFLLKALAEHYEKAKATDKFYEWISEPYGAGKLGYCLRIIGIKYRSGFWEGYVQVTVQIAEKYLQKWKQAMKTRVHVKTLGFHVEKASCRLLRELEKYGEDKVGV
jgi:hypothetical protein